MKKPRSRQAGMALISAIFLIVVLLGLGLAMTSLSGVQSDTESKSLLAAKVYYGARAGLEWGVQRAIVPDSCAGSSTFTLAEGALNGVIVTVTCSSTTLTGVKTYTFTSFAKTGTIGQLGYAERRLSATVSTVP